MKRRILGYNTINMTAMRARRVGDEPKEPEIEPRAGAASTATPVVDFPSAVRELLAESKRGGLSFEDAWSRAMAAVTPTEPGWDYQGTRRGRPPATLSPLRFLRQAMQSAYEGS